MKNLAYVNGPFQLMVLINLRMNDIDSFSCWDIVISDSFSQAEIVARDLAKEGLFGDVYFLKQKRILYGSKPVEKIKYLLEPTKLLTEIIPKIINKKYDIFWFYNYNIVSLCLFYSCVDKGINGMCRRFDEGFSSYTESNIPVTLSGTDRILSFLFARHAFINHIESYYYFSPEYTQIYKNKTSHTIPKFSKDNHELCNMLNRLFNIEMHIAEYDRKYIFFEESFSLNGIEMDDVELVKEICDVVGMENVMVKGHPRVPENRFKNIGVKTAHNNQIPFQAIELFIDTSSLVYLTVSSSMALDSSIYFNNAAKSVLLYKCVDKKSNMLSPNFYKVINQIKDEGMTIIPESKADLMEYLKCM